VKCNAGESGERVIELLDEAVQLVGLQRENEFGQSCDGGVDHMIRFGLEEKNPQLLMAVCGMHRIDNSV
jgi:hypothetical protein